MILGSSRKALTSLLVRAFFMGGFLSMGACSQQGIDLNDPAEVYGNYCFACHDTGAAGAPLLSNAAFWDPSNQDVSRLYRSTWVGVRAMPAKGTCLSCSEEQLKQVVDWMLSQS